MDKIGPIYIGEVIWNLRIQRGLTRAQLAEKCSLEAKSIYSIEHNKHEPRLRTVFALARAFEMEVLDLMKEIVDQFNKRDNQPST